MVRTKRGKDNKMSRQPPLPPGLPPKPSGPANAYAGDSYRPQSDSYYRQEPPPMYQFRGASDTSYRPPYDQRSRSPSRYNYAPGISPSRGLATDAYRRRDPSHDFNFHYEAPPSLDFRQTSYRPRSPPRQHTYPQESNGDNRQTKNTKNNRGMTRGGYRGRGAPRMASDREFLKGNRAPTPELMPGMDDDQGNAIRYIPIEDVSDSDEAEMDLSDDEDAEDAQQPKKKQARTETLAADGDSVPKWSNPDPYTALPPPDESHRKKKDVVKLIRKARVTAASENTTKTDAVADDFISFDFGDDDQDDDNMLGQRSGTGVVGAPTGPRFSHRDNAHKQDQQSGSLTHSLSYNTPKVLNEQERASRPEMKGQPNGYQAANFREGHSSVVASKMQNSSSGPAGPSREHQQPRNASQHGNDYKQQQLPAGKKQPIHVNPPDKPPAKIDLISDPALGNRKRTIRDEIKGPLKAPPLIHESSRGKKPPVNGEIMRAWNIKDGVSPTPWLSIDHSDSANMGVWLHKEIMDFYHFVKPRDFEQFIRTKLIEQLRNNVKESFAKDADIHPFGSFPAGLYLPTSDMDIVCVSDKFMRGGSPRFSSKGSLFKFDHFLKTQNLSLNGEAEIVRSAKVPLVKYVDRITGLKIDVSFENDTGLIANRTFQEWKATFPAMPILVTLIKHFLAMRGLNEPVNGGIGGFSVTCLVVSLLQNMPQVQSRSMIPEHHLGEILMEFFDLYGNQFNTETTAIQLNPPGYIPKSHANIPYKGAKLAILDPNRRDNDIAGGSHNTITILRCFSDAYKALQKRMGELQYSANRRNQSILGCIIGGNYTSFKLQREHLAHVHEQLYGPVELAR